MRLLLRWSGSNGIDYVVDFQIVRLGLRGIIAIVKNNAVLSSISAMAMCLF